MVERRKFMQGKRVSSNSKESLGRLYGEIEVSRDVFSKGEKKLEARAFPPFVKFCKRLYAMFPSMGKGVKFQEKYREAIEFLGWDLKPEEFAAAIKGSLILSMVGFLIAGALIYTFFGSMIDEMMGFPYFSIILCFGFPVILSLFISRFVQEVPVGIANDEKMRALTYVPSIVGYMIMSMKLVPNLERAVEFAAEHGEGKIAEDFKRILWEVQVGSYTTLAEALDVLAYRWGKYSEEFKLALMRIRASVLENEEGKRFSLLDKTLTNVLSSIKVKMEDYARGLSQPAVTLFYLGVLLPLILIIVLPVGSAFSGSPMARPDVLFLIYCIIIPAVSIMFSKMVIKTRPPTYQPPDIPDDHPSLPPKNTIKLGKGYLSIFVVIGLILVAGLGSSFFVQEIFGITKQKVLDREGNPVFYNEKGEISADGEMSLEEQRFWMKPNNDYTPYYLIFGVLMTMSACFFIYFYFTSIYKRKVQVEVMQMESEFKDSLYVLASRLGESKPIEDALLHTKSFLPKQLVSVRLFGKIIDNIRILGLPLEAAVFDKTYGALKNNPSEIIRSSMRLLVDSVQLGVNVAARTMISLSLQLTNSEKVNKMLSTLLQDVASMMKSISIFIAPVVLGITVSLQKIVMLTLSSITSSNALQSLSQMDSGALGGTMGIGNLTQVASSFVPSPDLFASMVTPAEFLFIVALYVIEIVVILNYFIIRMQEDNSIMVRLGIAKAVPIAIIIFIISVVGANSIVGGMVG
ncbi:MAG: hypothetical protein ABH821_01680 [archaeon]